MKDSAVITKTDFTNYWMRQRQARLTGKPFLTVGETAKILNIEQQIVRSMCRHAMLCAIKIDRETRILRVSLEKFVNSPAHAKLRTMSFKQVKGEWLKYLAILIDTDETEQRLKNKIKEVEEGHHYLEPFYLKNLLCKNSMLKSADIPDELVELKKLHLILIREIRQRRNENGQIEY